MDFRIKNSTVDRKPGNDMKKNASMTTPRTRSNQLDKGLGFDGLDNGSSQRAKALKVQVNQHTGHMNDGRDVQFRQMPNKKGNYAGKQAGPATAGQSKNPVDSGARAWAPSAGQNFKGNPDMIQDRQLANRKGNAC